MEHNVDMEVESTWRVVDHHWKEYTLSEVAKHRRWNDCWIVVHDRVYDMTPHVVSHEGWQNGGKQSTLLAVLSAMGQDCTEDFDDVHSAQAHAQLAAYQIGILAQPNAGKRTIRYKSWEQLVEEGLVPSEDENTADASLPSRAGQHPSPAQPGGDVATGQVGPPPVMPLTSLDSLPAQVAPPPVTPLTSLDSLPVQMVQHILCAGGSARSADLLSCTNRSLNQAVAALGASVLPIFPPPHTGKMLSAPTSVVAWDPKRLTLEKTAAYGHALITFDDQLRKRDAMLLLDITRLPALGSISLGLRGYATDSSRDPTRVLLNYWLDGAGRVHTYKTGMYGPSPAAPETLPLGECVREGDRVGVIFLASNRSRFQRKPAVGFMLNGQLMSEPIEIPPSTCSCYRFVLRFDNVPCAAVRLVSSCSSPIDRRTLLESARPVRRPSKGALQPVLVRTVGPDSRLYAVPGLDPSVATVLELVTKVAELLGCDTSVSHVDLTFNGRPLCRPTYHLVGGAGGRQPGSDSHRTLHEAGFFVDERTGCQVHDVIASLTHLIS